MPSRHIHAFARWQYTQSGLDTICTLTVQPPCFFHQYVAAAPITALPIAMAATRGPEIAPDAPYTGAIGRAICFVWHAGHHHEVFDMREIEPEGPRRRSTGDMPARTLHAGHHHEASDMRDIAPDGARMSSRASCKTVSYRSRSFRLSRRTAVVSPLPRGVSVRVPGSYLP
jgi:hypothetical protein